MTKQDAEKAATQLARRGYEIVVGKFQNDWIFANAKDDGLIAEMTEVFSITEVRDDR